MELVSLTQDGLSPLAAWYSSTGLAAERIGQEDTGKLVQGQRADLLVYTHDVLDQPAFLDQGALAEVVKDGVGYRGTITELPQKTFEMCVKDVLAPPPL